jgi:hypothetical protein
LNSGHELEIRIWDEPDISILPAAFEAIAFCELLMRSVKKQLARADSVEALGREKSVRNAVQLSVCTAEARGRQNGIVPSDK